MKQNKKTMQKHGVVVVEN